MSHTRDVGKHHYAGAVACIAFLATIAGTIPADAHQVRFGRLVHVRLLAEGVEVAMVVQLHAGPDALVLRQRFDADGDDRLLGDEVIAMRQWFEAEAYRDFEVTVAGDPVVLDGFDVAMDLLDDDGVARGGELMFRAVQRGTFVLRPGDRVVAITDAPANRREEIGLRVDIPPPVTLRESGTTGGSSRLVPMGTGSFQALVSQRPGTVTLAVTAPRDW